VNVIAPEGSAIATDQTRVRFAPERINVYADDWRVQGGAI
jgi:glycerol transport system ATP-binding protein